MHDTDFCTCLNLSTAEDGAYLWYACVYVCALVCSSVQQHVAVWCATCQRQSMCVCVHWSVAVCSSVLQCGVPLVNGRACVGALVCCSVEQRVAVWCATGQRQSVCVCVCIGVLQCAAACCSVVRHWSTAECVGVCIGVLQCAAACCSVVRHLSTAERVCVGGCIGVLQCAAACCSEVRHFSTAEDSAYLWHACVCVYAHASVCCSVFQRVAVYSSVLQFVTVCCNSLLQCVATLLNSTKWRVSMVCVCVCVRVCVLAFV